MRKAALFAADESSDTVEDRHLDEAIRELVVEGGSLTQSLLGFAKEGNRDWKNVLGEGKVVRHVPRQNRALSEEDEASH